MNGSQKKLTRSKYTQRPWETFKPQEGRAHDPAARQNWLHWQEEEGEDKEGDGDSEEGGVTTMHFPHWQTLFLRNHEGHHGEPKQKQM